ncbi:MAG: 23S rRNA (guanosine(2251)-2'-O)-methyltransferase RlmB, partial [Mycoplasmoidaceae bacterium]|nr:23S rRNA (guanosine(2251)-2'-O)-methyltransferase RlmB [Mycoplasmoidaceae bacterium]
NNKDKKQMLFLIVDSIEDPQNFGAILRTADGFGVDGVIYKKNNQVQINDLVAKTSMGAINTLNLFKVTNLVNEINLLKENGF